MARKHQESFESRVIGNLAASILGSFKMIFGKKVSRIDRSKIQSAWQEVERLSQGSIEEIKLGVVKADSLVDSILKLKANGQTMGERLKHSHSKFSHQVYNNLWEAHKLRNSIAHEAHFNPSVEDLRIAISRFRKALQEIGVL